MKREEINKTVASAIADVMGCELCTVSQRSNLVEDLGADSIDAVDILVQLETDLDFELSKDDYHEYIYQVHTVKDVCDLIEKYITN
jgi:acyl carrier protein